MSNVADRLTDAIVARDFAAARALLHPEIDFRAMTPSRTWEAAGPDDVETALRAWLANPDRDVAEIEALPSSVVQDTARVGWRVRGRDAGGPLEFEQQAYVRERDGQVGWLRVMCSGPRPVRG